MHLHTILLKENLPVSFQGARAGPSFANEKRGLTGARELSSTPRSISAKSSINQGKMLGQPGEHVHSRRKPEISPAAEENDTLKGLQLYWTLPLSCRRLTHTHQHTSTPTHSHTLADPRSHATTFQTTRKLTANDVESDTYHVYVCR